MSLHESTDDYQLHSPASHRRRYFLLVAVLAILPLLLLAGVGGLAILAPTVFESTFLLVGMSLLVAGLGLSLMLLGWYGLTRQRRVRARGANRSVMDSVKAVNIAGIWLGLGIFLMEGPDVFLPRSFLPPIGAFLFPVAGVGCILVGNFYYIHKLISP